MPARRQQQRRVTARQGAEMFGVSERHIRRLVALPRAEWLQKMADERETIRKFHDDEGHSWTQTAAHFGLHVETVKERAYRARKERGAEREAAAKGPTLFDFDALHDAPSDVS